jgi:hypothetical protein
VILGVVNPGDKVVIPDPTYFLYSDLIRMAGGECVSVPLRQDLHWDLGALEGALTDARLFVSCNPSNPTGIVHTRAELDALGEMLAGTDTLVLSDEAYSDLVCTPEPVTSALSVPALRGRTAYCRSAAPRSADVLKASGRNTPSRTETRRRKEKQRGRGRLSFTSLFWVWFWVSPLLAICSPHRPASTRRFRSRAEASCCPRR